MLKVRCRSAAAAAGNVFPRCIYYQPFAQHLFYWACRRKKK